jgi:hypothetical protein
MKDVSRTRGASEALLHRRLDTLLKTAGLFFQSATGGWLVLLRSYVVGLLELIGRE